MNETEWSSEINPYLYSQFIYDKEVQNIKWEKVSSTTGAGKMTAACKSVKVDHLLTGYAKINSKWIKDLNVALIP